MLYAHDIMKYEAKTKRGIRRDKAYVEQFYSLYRHGFARVAASTLNVSLANPAENAERVCTQLTEASHKGAAVCVFPELALSGYSIEDMLFQDVLLDEVWHGLEKICHVSADLLPVCVVGAPIRFGTALYNCAVVIHRGKFLGIVPKSYLPNYREFYEVRHFSSGAGIVGKSITYQGKDIPFGVDLLFSAMDVRNLVLGIEICEDLWVPIPPSSALALGGATVIANCSASNITVGKAEIRNLLCKAQSTHCIAAYIYSAAGEGESTTDLAWDGQVTIFEYGQLCAASERFPQQAHTLYADVDLGLLASERMRLGTFTDNARLSSSGAYAESGFRHIRFMLSPPSRNIGFYRRVARFPFVPEDAHRLAQDCYEAYTIQVESLKRRVRASGSQSMVIGVSGGLDSTQALLVTTRAADELGFSRKQVRAYTMPGFGTSAGTLENAWTLMKALGVYAEELDIRPSAQLMLQNMKHPFAVGEPVYDVTFENVQAGLRTDYLFRLANQFNGLVIGTGDMSELALGWCTYGVGDQMSHYNVNAGLPKTLIQHLIRWVISSHYFADNVGKTLLSILETEISPELVPSTDGKQLQSTEEKIGPYALQDFNLFYTLRYGFPPSKIAFLAQIAWGDVSKGTWPTGYPDHKKMAYEVPVIKKWLSVFLRRYFEFSQFKRSAMPNGPKIVAGGALSPRGDWRAPSDGQATIWLAELEENVPHR